MTRIRTDLPHRTETRDVWIPTRDGTRLSARIWLPVDAASHPVPAVLEYIPYRKGDGTIARDARMHPYVAGYGYATIRVDARGSGESEGVLRDEYLPQELDDGCDVIAWLADQPWCTGAVGMIGKSWGGFNGLQIAALRPPALRGVITVCSTDDRYADDVHYRGGAVLASKMLAWASTMFAANATPPDPLVVGDAWRDMWRERLEENIPFLETWMAHQRRDEYWKHGSVCEDPAAITCPVYAVGGWADGYSNAVLRILERLEAPTRGLIGPWGHQYPESGVPGPAIGFLQETVRWWDNCLKGIDDGMLREPALRVWMQEPVAPDEVHVERPGTWVTSDSWPDPEVDHHRFWLTPHGLRDQPDASGHSVTVRDTMVVGTEGGDWCPAGSASDLPLDQRAEDGRSVCFDTAPLPDDLHLLGSPTVTVRLQSDQPEGRLAVRLCDVAPDGTSLLVTRGILSLSHRDDHESPSAMPTDRVVTITMDLDAIAQRVPAGHRLRVAISTTYWPWVWPPAVEPTLQLDLTPETVLELPVHPDPTGKAHQPFGRPEVAPPVDVLLRRPGTNERVVRRDVTTGRVEVVRTTHDDKHLPDLGLDKGRHRVETCSMVEGDPLSCWVSSESTQWLRRGEWRVRVETSSTMAADATHFRGTNTLRAYEGEVCVFTSSRPFEVPRDHC